MSVLSDKQINKLIKKKKLEIIPFDKKSVTSNGYDLLTESFEISPGEFKIIRSSDRIHLSNKLIAIPFLRTTYAFKGLFLSAGIIDSGFKGKLRFALYNSSNKKTTITEKERIIHLVFFKITGEVLFPFGTREGEKNNLS